MGHSSEKLHTSLLNAMIGQIWKIGEKDNTSLRDTKIDNKETASRMK